MTKLVDTILSLYYEKYFYKGNKPLELIIFILLKLKGLGN